MNYNFFCRSDRKLSILFLGLFGAKKSMGSTHHHCTSSAFLGLRLNRRQLSFPSTEQGTLMRHLPPPWTTPLPVFHCCLALTSHARQRSRLAGNDDPLALSEELFPADNLSLSSPSREAFACYGGAIIRRGPRPDGVAVLGAEIMSRAIVRRHDRYH